MREIDKSALLEPIAIIGIGCRFPGGANDPDSFWKLMRGGIDAISKVPPDRFTVDAYYDPAPATPGKIITRYGGFLDGVDRFDAYFFGISPREARLMDPQQRVLLEVAWEAIEDAGLVLEKLADRQSRTGVFVGMQTSDYEDLMFKDTAGMDSVYMMTGGTRSVAAGRVSFAFDFRGPTVVVDAACASSLVGVHLACQSLHAGECDLALAAGTNLILQPDHGIVFSQGGMLAPDGRCKFADSRANGFVRSDGVGVVVLKRLSEARADGDAIYAVIRGSASNNDGRSGDSLMAPSALGQQAVLEEAYRVAGVSPGSVHYLECHGTGTGVGDPIELKAAGAVLSKGRAADRPLVVGSVKTNLGHTEGAAGIAGLIKAALCLKHRAIPASLHVQELQPAIPWKELPVVVQRQFGAWPVDDGPARAAVSSFGINGANAHAVLEEAPGATPSEEKRDGTGERVYLLPLSARAEEALSELAQRWQAFLAGAATGAPDLLDICHTASVRRNHHDHRLALVGRSRQALAEQLQAFVRGEAHPLTSCGQIVSDHGHKVVFVFPGQGGQWLGMGRELFREEPVFRRAIEACDRAISKFTDWSLLEQLNADEATSRLDEVDVVQPAIFSMQVALAALWRALGVEPAAVVGQSMGEVAAAHVSGALSLEDAARVICRRSQIVKSRASGRSGMAVVGLSLEETARVLRGYEDRLSIAVSNSPTSTVISGYQDALDEILDGLERQSVFCRRIKVDYASHSPQMDPLKAELLDALESLRPGPTSTPFHSTVNNNVTDGQTLDATYWVRNLREPVLMANSIEQLLKGGHTVFIEMNPHPLLLGVIRECMAHFGYEGTTLPSLRRDEGEREVLTGSLGSLYTIGYPLDWTKLYPGNRRPVCLPAYPWQHEHFWFAENATGRSLPVPRRSVGIGSGHPLLGLHLTSAAHAGAHLWETDLGIDSLPHLADHRVRGAVVLPATAYLEMALACAEQAFGPGPHVLDDVTFSRALVLPQDGTRWTVQVAVTPAMSGTASFQVFSRPGVDRDDPSPAPWTLHADGTIRIGRAGEPPSRAKHESPGEVQARCQRLLPGPDHYERMAARGLNYGPAFQGVEQVWCGDNEAIARISLPEAAFDERYRVHPVLLDAGLQVLFAAGAPDGPYLPVHLRTLRPLERPGARLWSHARLRTAEARDEDAVVGDVCLLDDDGNVVVESLGIRLLQLKRTTQEEIEDWLYEIRWTPGPQSEPSGESRTGAWIVLDDGEGLGESIRQLLATRGQGCVLVTPGEDFSRLGSHDYSLDPTRPDGFRRLLEEAVRDTGPACLGVVHLWSLKLPPSERTTQASLTQASELGSGSVVYLIQALAQAGWSPPPRLWLVTRGAQAIPDAGMSVVSVAQAPLWGLGRVIAYEHPELRCTRIDLDPEAPTKDATPLLRELLGQGQEDEIALRGDTRYVPRLARCTPPSRETTDTSSAERIQHPFDPEADRNFCLETSHPGILDNLRLKATARLEPGPGHVEIEIVAAALNFLDVLKAMGMYPGLAPGDRAALGAECAGRITAVGAGVTDFAVGDEVVAITPSFNRVGCFGAFVTVPALLVRPKPAGLTFEEATTIPCVFLTAYYGLVHLGRLQQGERVLIHSASGGVGLAAVQLVRQAGGEVFATAGSEKKREYLRSIGIGHVMDSRSLAFADEILASTNGEGVDVVLNSLVGEAIPKSLAVLRPCGRFLEIGKRDIYENSRIGLEPFKKNLSYYAIDLARLIEDRPHLIASLFRDVMDKVADGVLHPLPFKTFPISEATRAFRYMAQAEHTGKIVLTLHDDQARLAPAEPPLIHADATYLVTGGLGGLGLEVAKWMVSKGARHLVLVGRSKPSTSAQAVLDGLREAGAEVVTAGADVADAEQVRAVLSTIETSMPPLRGIVHAAGLLNDSTVLKQSLERINSVMAPKSGAWHLHTLTKDAALDFFVLFSSVASTLGSPGQSNYAAANAFLDALVHHRRARGLPALGINWGPWSDVGLAAAERGRGERLADRGLGSIAPAQGINVLEHLLRRRADQISVMPLDPGRWCRSYPVVAHSSLLAGWAPPPAATDTPRPEGTVAPAGASAPPTESWLISQIREQAAKVLGLPASRIAPNKRLEAYGLDSLMGVELSHRLSASLGVALPGNIVWQHPTVAQLAAHLTEKTGGVPPSHLAGAHRERSATARPEDGRPSSPADIRDVGDVTQSPQASGQAAHVTSSLVPLKPEGSRPPLFLVPPAGFTASCFGPLLTHLEPDQPVYGLQPLGMDGKDEPQERVEDMAALYKNEILHVQPHGPYLLAGRCFGGLVALEIALQLHDEGHEVAMLGLFDVLHPPATRPRFPLIEALLPLLDLKNPADSTSRRVLRYCAATLVRRLLAVLWRLGKTEQRFGSLPEAQARAISETYLAHRRARVRYVSRVYPGKITLFSATRFGRKAQMLWANFTTGGLQRHFVPGNHGTCFREPHVRVLAAKLTESIHEGLADPS